MMNKTKSPTSRLSRYLLILPLALFLITLNSCLNKEKKKQEPDSSAPESTVVSPVESPADLDEIFVVVEDQPEFPGGNEAMMKFLAENIKYPAVARDNGTQGRVVCNFVVEKDGSISDVEVVRGVHSALDAEAIRVIQSMPKWTPGKQRGHTVRVRYTLPVVFKLQQ